MGKITLNRLKPGMVLGSDVHDRSGRLLLGAETELSEKHLTILRTWGVTEVDIKGEEEECSHSQSFDAIPPEVSSAIENDLLPLFIHADINHPAIKEMLRMRILHEAADGKKH